MQRTNTPEGVNKRGLKFWSEQVNSQDIYIISDCLRQMERCAPLLKIHPEMGISPRNEIERIYNLLSEQYDALSILSQNDFLGK
jgi:hypothetical protein